MIPKTIVVGLNTGDEDRAIGPSRRWRTDASKAGYQVDDDSARVGKSLIYMIRGLRGGGSSGEEVGGFTLINSSNNAFSLDVEEGPLRCCRNVRPERPADTGVITCKVSCLV